jgi:hypothetical protein
MTSVSNFKGLLALIIFLAIKPATGDSIKLISQQTPEVSCFNTSFNGFVANYAHGRFHVVLVMEQCVEDKGIPKECDLFTRRPQGVTLPPHVEKALKDPLNRGLYHEFREEDINVIEFNDEYTAPCMPLDIESEKRKKFPIERIRRPAVMSQGGKDILKYFPKKKILDDSYIASLRKAGVKGEPLADYNVSMGAVLKKTITAGEVVPLEGPRDVAMAMLAGRVAIIEASTWPKEKYTYDTYFLEGPLIYDKVNKMMSIKVATIWQAMEKVTFDVAHARYVPSTALRLDIQSSDNEFPWPWNVTILGSKRFLRAQIVGVDFDDGRRILKVRAPAQAMQGLPLRKEVIRLSRVARPR